MKQSFILGEEVRVLEHHPDPACVIKPLPLSDLLLGGLCAAADGEAWHREDLVPECLGEQCVTGMASVGTQQLQNRVQVSIWGSRTDHVKSDISDFTFSFSGCQSLP